MNRTSFDTAANTAGTSRRKGYFLGSLQGPQSSAMLATWRQAIENFFNRMAQRPVRSFAIWSLWLSCLYFLLGPGSYVRVADVGNGTLPARLWEANALIHGGLGDWFPLSCCGSDRVLNAYRMELPSVLFAVLPGWLAYGAITFLQRFVAGYFFFRLMRDNVRTRVSAAFVAGLAYSLYYQRGIHNEWDGFALFEGLGVPALPLLLWSIHRLHDWRSWLRYPAALAGGVALALSATYYQVLFFPLLVVFWFTLICRVLDRKMLGIWVAMAAGWIFLQGPQMLAAAQYAPLSHRAGMLINSHSDFVQHIENVQHWPKLIINSNMMLLIIAAAGLVLSGFRERRLIWSLAAVGVILMFVRKYLFFCDHVFSHLGMLSAFHFHRVVQLTPFLMALAAGLGIEAAHGDWHVEVANKERRWAVSAGFLVLAAMFIQLTVLSYRVNTDRLNNTLYGESYELLFHHPDVQAVADKKNQLPPFRVACVIDAWSPTAMAARDWTFAPGYAWAYGLETADGYLVMYSSRYKKFWSQVLAGVMQQDQWCWYKQESWGNMVYLWQPTSKDIEFPFRFQDMYDLDLLSLANVRFIFSPVPLDDPQLKLLPSEYRNQLIEWQHRHSASRVAGMLKNQWEWEPLYVYENQDVLPRYQFVGSVRACDGEQATLDALGKTDSRRFRTEAIVDRNDLGGTSIDRFHGDRGAVQLVSQKTDELDLEVNCEGPGMVVVANTFSPNWRAEVDGQPAPIVPANYTFQGIAVEKGVHRVHLQYRGADRWASLWENLTRKNLTVTK